jgi:hypothetical protein
MRSLLLTAGLKPLEVGAYIPFGGVLDRMPGLRRLVGHDNEPTARAKALVDAAPALLGTQVFARARRDTAY